MAFKSIEHMREYHKNWHQLHKEERIAAQKIKNREMYEWFLEVKRGYSCIRCGEADIDCLDFHHRDPSQKVMPISMLIRRTTSKARVLAEIAKCDPLCCNCHRKLHALR